MRIGLDIDNVVTDFDKKILEEFYKEDKNKRNKGIVNPDGNWIKNMFDWSVEEVEKFFNENMQEIAKILEPRKDAKYYMDKLLNEGHSLYLISHRAYPHYTEPYKVTKEWLKNNDIHYTKLILSKDTNKSRECKENNIDIMFDDVRNNCHQLIESGIKCYLMGTNYNQRNLDGLDVVQDWKELYEVIRDMDKKKVILDTDMYNEIDDQFALTYLIKSLDVFDLQAITIAPFSKSGYANTMTIEDGTEKSYETTLNILDMLNKPEYKSIVYKGAIMYMQDSEEDNDAVNKIIEIANRNKKTIILAIGAITNVALAIKKAPEIISRIKVVWLGGNTFLTKDNSEFNFRQDIKAVQTVFESKVELVVIPCRNVASNLSTTIYELEHYLNQDTKLNNYLKEIFIKCKKSFMKEPKDEIGSSKTLWDLSAIAYEINADWFKSEMISCPIVLDNGLYQQTTDKHNIIFVNDLYRNKIYQDFFIKMGAKYENE
ncbi:MAG: nucleoside hydrolase [Bacilli bacterium]|nr:nucleoside hydrolase [Bacilli bacterium]